jgi:CBS domain-containing protein
VGQPAQPWCRDVQPGSDFGRTAHRRCREAQARPIGGNRRTGYTSSVSELSERAVATRVPSLADEKLKVLSRRDPVTVRPGTSLAECVAAIQRSGTGDSVFVTTPDGRLAGVLTERDIFGRLVDPGADVDLARPVESLMTTRPHTLTLEQSVRDAIDLMQTGRYRNLPIVDGEGLLVGVVRPQDVLKYLAEAFPEELLNLPPRPHQQMEQPEGG